MPLQALIAEFDIDAALRMKRTLGQEGFEVVHVRDGAEAIRAFSGALPDLFVCDLSLPGRDGFAVLAELRQRAGPSRVPAIATSSFVHLRSQALAKKSELGLAAVIGKSHGAAFIQRTLRAALGRAESTAPAPADEPGRPAEEEHGFFRIPSDILAREPDRLRRIADLDILHGPDRDEGLLKLVYDAARIFGVPSAAVSIVDDQQQRMIAQVGFGPGAQFSGAREDSFCRCLVEADQASVLLIPDATLSPLFKDNPLVRQGLLRSYAGAPLVTSTGEVLGSLCIADTRPLSIGAEQIDALLSLARRVAGELELRGQAARRSARAASEIIVDDDPLETARAVLEQLDQPIVLLGPDRRVLFANRAAGDLFQTNAPSLIGLDREQLVDLCATLADDPAGYRASVEVAASGPYSYQVDFHFRIPRHRIMRASSRPLRLPSGIGQLTSFTDISAVVELRELKP